jgi:hypothetical protein
MQIFTHEMLDAVVSLYGDMKPSENTLKLIRQVAYTYRVKNEQAYCLN